MAGGRLLPEDGGGVLDVLLLVVDEDVSVGGGAVCDGGVSAPTDEPGAAPVEATA